jgi:hypothetical protein
VSGSEVEVDEDEDEVDVAVKNVEGDVVMPASRDELLLLLPSSDVVG